MAKQKKFPLFVSLYSWQQAYGGAEEGGWYYDVDCLELSYKIPAGRNQQAKIRQAKKWLVEDAHNMRLSGWNIIVEKKCGSHDSSRKPAPIYC